MVLLGFGEFLSAEKENTIDIIILPLNPLNTHLIATHEAVVNAEGQTGHLLGDDH